MSVDLWKRVWPLALSPSEKLVLLALADHTNGATGKCYPAVARLAKVTGLSRRHVQRCLKALADIGHLTVYPRWGQSSFYKIHPRHAVTPDTTSPATPMAIKGDPESADRRHPVTQTMKNHYSNQHAADAESRAREMAKVYDRIQMPEQANALRRKAGLDQVEANPIRLNSMQC